MLNLKLKLKSYTCQSCIRSIIYITLSLFQELTTSDIRHIEEPFLQLADANRSTLSDDEDFFSNLQSCQAQDGAKQLDGYLTCSSDHMNLLKSFPAVCKLSVKLNTPLPASVACEAELHRRTCLQPKNSKTEFSQL